MPTYTSCWHPTQLLGAQNGHGRHSPLQQVSLPADSATGTTVDSGLLVLWLSNERKSSLFKGTQAGFSTVHSNMGTSQGSAVRKTYEFHFLSSSPRTSHRLQDIPRLQPPSSSSLLHLPSLPGLETCPVTHTTNNWPQVSCQAAEEGKPGQNPNPHMCTLLPPSSHPPPERFQPNLVCFGTHAGFLLPVHLHKQAVPPKCSASLPYSFSNMLSYFGKTATSVLHF